MPWKDEREPTIKLCMGTKIDVVQKFIRNTETWTELTASQWNSSGIFSKDSISCSSVNKSSLLLRVGETPENFTGKIIFMSMFNDISWESRDNKVELMNTVHKENGTELQNR